MSIIDDAEKLFNDAYFKNMYSEMGTLGANHVREQIRHCLENPRTPFDHVITAIVNKLDAMEPPVTANHQEG